MDLPGTLRPILVAVRDLPAGRVLRADDLAWLPVQVELLAFDTIVGDEALVGRTLTERTLAHEPFRTERLDRAAATSVRDIPRVGPVNPGATGTTMVFLVGRTLDPGTVLTLRDVFLMPGVALSGLPPVGTLRDPRQVVGRVVTERMYEHELLRTERL